MKVYVYALVDRRLPPVTLHGRRIESVKTAGLYALAERAVQAPAISEHALREQHDIVVRLAARSDAILPARFGSLLDRDELAAIVSARRAAITDALALVRGREQMTVRLRGAGPEDARPRPCPTRGPGAAYLETKRAAVGYPLPEAVDRLGRAMTRWIAAQRAEPGSVGVRVTIYHLIERGTSEDYRHALAAAADAARPYAVDVTGPWPPFAFAPELL